MEGTQTAMMEQMSEFMECLTLGTRAKIPSRYMVNTLRTQITCVSNMPSDQMLNTFRMCPAMCPQYAQWPNVEHILNVYGHVSPIYPVITELGTFGMIAKICSQCTQLGTL